MKHIIYLNSDILNSYIAQIDNGIVTKYTEERGEDANVLTAHSTHGRGAENVVKINAPIISFSRKTNTQENDEEFAIERTDYGKNLIERIFHDDLLNNLIDQLNKERILKTEIDNLVLGDYVNIKFDFDIFDLEYIKQITDKENMKRIFSFDKNSNSNSKSNNSNEQINYLEKLVKTLDTILPFNKAIVGNNLICPLNEKYMRESLREIRFKYSGNITVLGKATKKKHELNETKYINIFGDFNNAINEVINTLFPKTDMTIITPIALFFE